MAKVMMIHPDKCTGCRRCERACALKHKGSDGPGAACVHAFTWRSEGFSIALMCQQCDNAACVNICRTGAMHHGTSDSNLVELDRSACIGCKMCVIACPFGSVRYDSANHAISKCDQCDGAPRCVASCPNGALEFADDAERTLTRKREIAQKLKAVFEEARA